MDKKTIHCADVGKSRLDWMHKRAGKDHAPELVQDINQKLYDLFKDSDHYVAIEKTDDQYQYVHRWAELDERITARARSFCDIGNKSKFEISTKWLFEHKPTMIAPYNPDIMDNNAILPIFHGSALLFDIPNIKVIIQDNGDKHYLRFSEDTSEFGYDYWQQGARLLVIPVDRQGGRFYQLRGNLDESLLIHEARRNRWVENNDLYPAMGIHIESSTGQDKALKRSHAIYEMKLHYPSGPGVWNWPGKNHAGPMINLEEIKQPKKKRNEIPKELLQPSKSRIAPPISQPGIIPIRLKPVPKDNPKVDIFVTKVVKVIQDVKKTSNEDLEIVFALDNSGSMESAAALVIQSIGKILSELKHHGAKSINASVVIFNHKDNIRTYMPMHILKDDSIVSFLLSLTNIPFWGGEEPVGEAVYESFKLFSKDVAVNKSVFVLTDDDGLRDDRLAMPIYDDAKKEGEKQGVAVELELCNGKVFLPLHMIALDQILHILFDVKNLEEMSRLNNPKAIAMLISIAENDNYDGYSRLRAAEFLLEKNKPKALEVLKSIAAHNYVNEIRLPAAERLLDEGDNRGLKFLSDIIDHLEHSFVPNIPMQLRIMSRLIAHGNRKYIDTLVKIGTNPKYDLQYRLQSATLLLDYDKERAKDILEQIMDTSDVFFTNRFSRRDWDDALRKLDRHSIDNMINDAYILLDVASYINTRFLDDSYLNKIAVNEQLYPEVRFDA